MKSIMCGTGAMSKGLFNELNAEAEGEKKARSGNASKLESRVPWQNKYHRRHPAQWRACDPPARAASTFRAQSAHPPTTLCSALSPFLPHLPSPPTACSHTLPSGIPWC